METNNDAIREQFLAVSLSVFICENCEKILLVYEIPITYKQHNFIVQNVTKNTTTVMNCFLMGVNTSFSSYSL